MTPPSKAAWCPEPIPFDIVEKIAEFKKAAQEHKLQAINPELFRLKFRTPKSSQ